MTRYELLVLIEKRGYESLRAALRAVLEIKTYAEQGVPLSSMDFEMELQDEGILKVRQAIAEELG